MRQRSNRLCLRIEQPHLSWDVAELLKLRLGPDSASEGLGKLMREVLRARACGLPFDRNASVRLPFCWRSAALETLPILDMRSALLVLTLPVFALSCACASNCCSTSCIRITARSGSSKRRSILIGSQGFAKWILAGGKHPRTRQYLVHGNACILAHSLRS